MPGAWDGNWKARIYARVWKRGFKSVTAFAEVRPLDSLLMLSEALGSDVAAVQLEALLREEARGAGELDRFARGLFVRYFREEIPDGWAVSEHYDFTYRRAGAFTSWSMGMELSDEETEGIWSKFESLDLPRGWLPSGPDDPVLDRIFAGVTFGAPTESEHTGKDGPSGTS